ncbi:glycine-rich cell wall structural protein 1.0-like [Capsicum annuum]|uniref:glycine-rich cell wall structural protein 1.0-like n=1 Tax=Capsicum annuum TaxID=4072 RepID=UPI001FB0D570|nr:glycine-rich cell wall structural protein 1.0-like [Capsicum annuum]
MKYEITKLTKVRAHRITLGAVAAGDGAAGGGWGPSDGWLGTGWRLGGGLVYPAEEGTGRTGKGGVGVCTTGGEGGTSLEPAVGDGGWRGGGDEVGAADRRSVPAVESGRRRRTAAAPGTGDRCRREGERVGAGGQCRSRRSGPEIGSGRRRRRGPVTGASEREGREEEREPLERDESH